MSFLSVVMFIVTVLVVITKKVIKKVHGKRNELWT